MSQSIYEELQNLLKLYEMHEKITQSKPTFMQISGYPHFENVCSNILQFYFNPENCHGLKLMLLFALMTSIQKIPDIQYFQDVIVEREYPTDKNNRIDLLIRTNKYVIGIENKIYSGIHNDLIDYSNTIDKIGNTDGKETIKIVLSIRDESSYVASTASGFINITYENFINSVEQYLGKYVSNSDNIYLLYFLDFIRTLKAIYGGITMDSTKITFFKENKNKIMSLISETISLKNELRRITTDLGNLIDSSELEKKYSGGVRKWFYRENDNIMDTLVYDVTGIHGIDKTIAIDVTLDLDGWTISSFIRGGDINTLKAVFDRNNIANTYNPKTGRLQIDTFKFDEKIDIVASKVYEFLMKVKDIT